MTDSAHRSIRTTPAFLALGAVGFIASAPVYAADTVADEAHDEPQAIIVTGTKQDDAPKTVAPPLNTPRSIVTVDKQVIKDTGSATLVDALRTVPGITFGAAEGGNPIGDRPFIRGFDSQGSTFLDGVRDLGAQSREVFAVEQIQVIRGSDGTLGGRGSAGGSLNIISKLPQNHNFVAGSLSYGTSDYKRATIDANYMLGDTIALRINAMWHDQDVAGRDAIYQKRWGIAPSVTIGVGGPTNLTLSYYHLDTDELPDTGMPYHYTIGNAPLGFSHSEPVVGDFTTAGGVTAKVDRSTFYGLKDRDFRDTKTDQFTLRAQHDFGGVKLRNITRYSHNNQAYIFTQPDDSKGNVVNGQVWRRTNTRYGSADSIINQTDLFGTAMTGSVKHSFAVGAELSWEKARRGAFVLANGSAATPICGPAAVARYNCTSLFNPNPKDPWVNYASDGSTVQTPISRQQRIQETQNDATTQSLYAFDSITISPALILNLGARVDRFTSEVTPGQPVTATSTFKLKRKDTIFNYQAGLVFKPSENTSLYASYATSATPPNSLLGEGTEGNALGTTEAAAALLDALKVEKTRSIEVGAKADLLDGRLSLNAALFDTKTSNARVTGASGLPEFVGERQVRGAEIGFNGAITPQWTVFGGYTYLDAEIVDGGMTALTVAANGAAKATTVLVPSVNTGKRFPQTAKHSFSIWSNLEVLPGFKIGGGAFYTSRVFGGYADNRSASQTSAGVITVNPATKEIARSVPGYVRFDARMGYKINDNLEVSVNVQNLTDKVYFSQAYSSHYAGIAPGRSAFATLDAKF